MTRRALITGISGQDGMCLTKELRRLGFIVAGTTRNQQTCEIRFRNFNVPQPDYIFEGEIGKNDYINNILKEFNPDLIFHFSGQSSVRSAIKNPSETWESVAETTEKLFFNALKRVPNARILNAASSECFGPRVDVVSSTDELKPNNPYSQAKVYAVETARRYRRNGSLYIANAFLFPHESHMRDSRFLVGRIFQAAHEFYFKGIIPDLSYITDLTGRRDIGLASEYVKGMLLLVKLNHPADCVIGTGVTLNLRRQMMTLISSLGLSFPYALLDSDNEVGSADMSSNCAADVQEMLEVISWRPATTGPEVMNVIAKKFLDINLHTDV